MCDVQTTIGQLLMHSAGLALALGVLGVLALLLELYARLLGRLSASDELVRWVRSCALLLLWLDLLVVVLLAAASACHLVLACWGA